MSFGYSVGDFIAVVQLAYKVYDGCKSSVEEYRDIGRDVGNTHLVLSANERYWKAEESRGRSLIVAQEEDLKQLAGNSYEIFGKIQAVLDKHRSLGDRERVRDKLKWSLTSFMKDIGPQRQSLQDNTHALAIFNATLTAENASSIADQQTKILQEHSQLLKFLVTRYIEFQNGPGNSVAPAFSRVGVKDIEEDEDDSWRNINTEFESAGISSTTVKENRGFIREWIATVIADDGEKETAVTAGSTIVEDDEDTVVAAVGDLEVSNTLKDVQPGEKEPELEEPTKPLKQAAPPPLPPPAARQASASSHRSQSSTWREPDINNPNHSSQMIAKVLKSKYGDCNDLYQLPIKRAFHHLDWTDRGWISIGEVQKYCYQAAEIAGFSLNESALGQLAKEMDVDDDNQVSLGELTEIVVTLRRLILEFIIIVNANNNGRIEAGAQLKVLFDTSLDLSMLPFGWNYWQMPNSCRLYRHDFLHSILGQKQSIAPLQTNFTNAAFIATGHCASQVSSALKKWRASLLSMPKEEAGEYTQALNNVLEATAKFHTLNSTHSQTKLHPFDYCSERINILPPGQLEDLADYPEAELTELCRNCWRVLDPILGFVYDLKPDGLKQVFLRMPSKVLVDLSTTPPSLSEWRRLRMLERSKRIVQDLGCWKEMKKVIQKCQEWTNVHNDCLDVKAKSVIETTENLSRVQREAVQNASLHSLEIREVRLTKLKRDHFGRNPSTIFTVIVDGKMIGTSRSQKSTTPIWYHGKEYEVSRTSIVRIEFHDGKLYDEKLTPSRSLIGSLDFKVTDVTNFDGHSLVTKNGPLLLPSSSVLKVAAPEVSIEVYTNWGEDFILESMGKGRLAADIAMSPTIPGWEARRTKANDVYFINSEKGQSTACLWREIVPSNDDTSMKITPIPEGWTIAKVNGRVLYRSPGSKLKETPPEPDGKSTYEKVIKSKEYCQLLEFFPQYLIDQYEKDAKPPEPAPFIPRYLRLPPAVR